MQKVHSHYENLKVARDASADDIRAAYRTLTRKHHPDRNPGNPDAERVMAVINVAYGVLSDSAGRVEHDRWITQAESPSPRPVRSHATLHSPTDRYRGAPSPQDRAAASRARLALLERRIRRAAAHVAMHRVAYALAGAVMAGLIVVGASTFFRAGLALPMAAAVMPAAHPPAGYVRAATAPNGQRWPARSGYVEGYPQTNTGGLSEVMIDNSQSDVDMFAKLFSLDGPTALPVRVIFVAARSRFTLAGLTIGTYDLRYRNLTSGDLLRSPAFILEEVTTVRGTQHSMPTVKLYDGGDGSLQAYALGDAEF